MPARACGMIRIVRHRTIRTTNATTSRTMSAATTASLFVDEGGRALDADDLDPGARLEDLMLVPGTGRPHLAADLHPATLRVHALEDHGSAPHQGGRAGAKRRRKADVAASDRPNDGEHRQRSGDEGDELQRHAATERGHDRGGHGGYGDQPEYQSHCQDLADGQDGRHDRPDQPGGHRYDCGTSHERGARTTLPARRRVRARPGQRAPVTRDEAIRTLSTLADRAKAEGWHSPLPPQERAQAHEAITALEGLLAAPAREALLAERE